MFGPTPPTTGAILRDNADLVLHHLEDALPWNEAATGAALPQSLQASWQGRLAGTPAGHAVYVAATPLSFGRDGMGQAWGPNGPTPRQPPWDTVSFDNPAAIRAYLAYCRELLRVFRPRYFAYAVEANMLAQNAPELWPGFLRLSDTVYHALAREHPGTPIFATVQGDFYHRNPGAQEEPVRAVLERSDVVAISTYAFIDYPAPETLPAEYFSRLRALGPGKDWAIAETSWPAEPLGPPLPAVVPASEAAQATYLERLLVEANAGDAVFVNWFFPRDYDYAWEREYRHGPAAALYRIWRDTGLWAGDGTPRTALASWRRWLEKPRD